MVFVFAFVQKKVFDIDVGVDLDYITSPLSDYLIIDNMTLLNFDIPKKINTTKAHNEKYLSDSGVNGTYVPNMSKEDMESWKAKHIKGTDERIEIRKTFHGVQMLIVVYKKPNPVEYSYKNRDAWNKRHNDVKMSMNGKLDLTLDEFFDINEAVKEAFEILL